MQKLQAGEALRNTSHSSTAADLLQAKQQILAYQQELEEQEQLLRNYQMKNEDLEVQVSLLQQKVTNVEMVCISFIIVFRAICFAKCYY